MCVIECYCVKNYLLLKLNLHKFFQLNFSFNGFDFVTLKAGKINPASYFSHACFVCILLRFNLSKEFCYARFNLIWRIFIIRILCTNKFYKKYRPFFLIRVHGWNHLLPPRKVVLIKLYFTTSKNLQKVRGLGMTFESNQTTKPILALNSFSTLVDLDLSLNQNNK